MKIDQTKYLLFLLLIATVCARGESIPLQFPPINGFSTGTGFTGAAMIDNAASIYWNPAGLAYIEDQTVDFTFSGRKLRIPGSWSLLIANNSYDEKKPFGFGIVRRLTEQVNDNGDDPESITSVRSFSVMTPIAFKSRKNNFAVGVSLKFIGEKITGSKWKYGTAFDAGTVWRITQGLFFTSTSRNYISSNLHSFPAESWFGASVGDSYSPFQFGVQVRGDKLQQLKWTSRHYRYGGRIRIAGSPVELRGGYVRDGDVGWITAGAAYWTMNDDSHFDYSVVVNRRDSGNPIHFVTYGYSVSDALTREMRKLRR